MIDQEQIQEFESIYNILKENPENYHGYEKLGIFYQKTNINQAFLCYEQAWGFCNDVYERKDLEERMQFCKKDSEFQVHPVSFIILSYNAREMMIDCLESIRNGCVPGSYEIVVVDNDSQDGIRDYLGEQKDIVLQLNDHNTSFAAGCNQGVKLANPYNDIFLLNNDTIVPPLALFYMRLALYEADDIASVGPMTNSCYLPQIAPGDYKTVQEWLANAEKIHLPLKYPIEYTVWLVGFALLIRRKAWDSVGCLDERFIRGNAEDTEYGFRLIKSGYRNVICHNAFIYHYGHVSMAKDLAAYQKSMVDNRQRLTDKLGFDYEQYSSYNRELIGMIDAPENTKISVLLVGCGFGLMLSLIKYKYPEASVMGIEENEMIATIGKQVVDVICANVETDSLPIEENTFDYIFIPDMINYFKDAQKALTNLKKYVKKTGKMIVLSRNPFWGGNFIKILKGHFETIWDDPQIRHHYTKDEVIGLLSSAELIPRSLIRMVTDLMDFSMEERQCLETIKNLPGIVIGQEFNTFSYIITATRT